MLTIPSFVRSIEKERFAALAALLVLMVLSTVLSPFFLVPENLLNIFRQVSYTGIIALGMTFVIISGGIDLSVGSMAAFVGALGILSLNQFLGMGLAPELAITLAIGAVLVSAILCGLINGLLVTKARIAPFIVTLGTMAIFRSLALYMGNAGEFRSESSLFGDLGAWSFFGFPLPALVMVLLAAIFAVLLGRTQYGRYVRAVGSNARVARYSAIDVDLTRMLAYVLSGLTVGISSVLISMRFNSVGSSTLGINYEMDAIAAVIIGGTAMAGGRGSVWGTIIGAIILGVINNMLNMVGISPYLQGAVKGAVIIVAVFIQRQKQ